MQSLMRFGALLSLAAVALLSGCQSAPETKSASAANSSGPTAGNISYRDHKDLQKIWLADGFDFNGFDTLYIADTRFQGKERPNEAEIRAWAISYLQQAIADSVRKTGVFTNVVLREANLKPGAKALKLENTITEYEKGGGGARYFAGIYGAGQPVLKVQGRVLDGDKPVFQFNAKRSGDSGMDRVFGGFVSDKDVQQRDIDDLAKDLAAFITATAKHTPAK